MPALGARQFGQIEIKKSKFFGLFFIIHTLAQAEEILADLRAEYGNASHLVFAWRIRESGQLREKFYNDKEPSSTGGQPLLYLLQKKDISNCLLVVVRYFGGTKLGVGGLIRAYTKAGQLALANNLKAGTDGK